MATPNNKIKNLGQKVAIVAGIQVVSAILNSIATYKQYQNPIDTKSSIISFAALTVPSAIGSLGSSLYLKDNSENNYLYLGLHAIPFTTRALTYFVAGEYS